MPMWYYQYVEGRRPDRAAVRTYGELHRVYQTLHDAFGTGEFAGRLDACMKDLIAVRDRVRQGGARG